ncbi:hypothetical protein PMAYCL1PPCAC_28879, partial [Pristionchus mayeri]
RMTSMDLKSAIKILADNGISADEIIKMTRKNSVFNALWGVEGSSNTSSSRGSPTYSPISASPAANEIPSNSCLIAPRSIRQYLESPLS